MKDTHIKEGIIFNIQRYSIHDGPGIRTTIFLKGCPLKCKWCSNPESINPFPELFLRKERCDQCRKCLDTCKPRVISLNNDDIQINRALCTFCMKCVEVCYPGALSSIGTKTSINDIMTEIMKDELFYNNSGGGVTISGGEPLYQLEFTLNILKECKKRSLHTTLDTTGYTNRENFDKILPFTDLILFDIKHLNSEIHQKGTGVPNEKILKNFEASLIKGKKVWVRVPIIPNFNDSNNYITELAEFLAKKPIEKISLLKYHQWGKHKYKYLDRTYPLKDSILITNELIEDFKHIIESHGLKVTIDY